MKNGDMVDVNRPMSLDIGKVSEVRVAPDRIEVFIDEPHDTVAFEGPGRYKYVALGKATLIKLDGGNRPGK